MNTVIKYVFTGIAAATTIFVIYSLVFFDLFSDCPIEFRFEYETRCWVRDARGDTKLIELFNPGQSTGWLAKISDTGVVWLEHPVKRAKNYKGKVTSNVIKFVDDEKTNISVNGELFEPMVLGARPLPGYNE